MTGIIVTAPPAVELPPGNSSSNPATLPPVTYQFAVLSIPQTWSAKQTFPLGMITLNAADITGTLPFGDMPALTGDITTVAGNVVTTLATVNANVGTFGSATQSVQFTANAKGLLTAAANVTITPAIGSVTGMGTGVGAALAVNVGTAGAPVINGGALGTPSSGNLSNATSLPVSTGISGFAAGIAAFLATPSSANLITAVTDETGTGALVFANTPTLVTPVLGVATVTSINKVAITAPATSATITIPDGVTLTGPASSGTAMTLGNTETVTGVKTFGSAGAVGRLKVAGTTSGSTVLDATAIASGTLTLPAATDTLVGKATTDILTNKTFNSAGTGNVLQVSGVTVSAGQFPGVTSNTPATAGNIGELIYNVANSFTAVVTITIASPAVITMTGYKASINPSGTANLTGGPITFTTTGALPTGIVSGTTYYIIPIDANTYNIATTIPNAFAGTKVNTSGTQSGTHTGFNTASLTSTVTANVLGIQLSAGEWDVSGVGAFITTASTTTSYFIMGTSSTSATIADIGSYTQTSFVAGTTLGSAASVYTMPMSRYSFAAPTIVYALANSSFGVSTLTGYGQIRATRAH